MEIRVCREEDIEILDEVAPTSSLSSFHAFRFARQQVGLGTYLVAWQDEEPIGSCEVRWDGCPAFEVRNVCGLCAEINGLVVWPESMRSRGIGAALIHSAEDVARQRGHRQLGLGVEEVNHRAAGLYARLGYSPVTVYIDRWSYAGIDGTRHPVASTCAFMIKAL